MIRLSQAHGHGRETVFRIEGRLDVEAVQELRSVVQKQSASALAIDLSGLSSLDAAGQRYLTELRTSGVRLRGASLYITRLLEEA